MVPRIELFSLFSSSTSIWIFAGRNNLSLIFYFIFTENDEEDATTWGGSDRDYTYDELLQRVYNIMKEKNPDSVVGETKKFVMRPPQVVKVGAKKTAFVNFSEIAKM